MKIKGSIKGISKDLTNNKYNLTLELENVCKEEYEALKDKELNVELKEYKKKRSLDANAYLWVLLHKMSKIMKLPASEIYKMEIKEIGVCEILPLKNEAVDRFVESWSKNGLGWICDIIGESKHKGFTNIKAYYGSSVYDSKEMSILLNNVVENCKLQGIQTLDELELEKMVKEWGI